MSILAVVNTASVICSAHASKMKPASGILHREKVDGPFASSILYSGVTTIMRQPVSSCKADGAACNGLICSQGYAWPGIVVFGGGIVPRVKRRSNEYLILCIGRADSY